MSVIFTLKNRNIEFERKKKKERKETKKKKTD